MRFYRFGLFQRRTYMKATDVIWMLRKTEFDAKKLAESIEDGLRERGLLP